ncbi:hypothetical protein BC833DRAFT_311103 [Globomyces pollinis-pini]|nr:hypothetical protein BC833DRAFT_311103 [Globomyces pollinis-pini]
MDTFRVSIEFEEILKGKSTDYTSLAHLEFINLNGVNLFHFIDKFISMVQSIPTVKSCVLSDCNVTEVLDSCLPVFQTLESLYLKRNSLDDDDTIKLSVLVSSLKNLSLATNRSTNIGIQKLMESVSKSSTIEMISLGDMMNFNDDCTKTISDHLLHQTSLTTLFLQLNQITDIGLHHLSNCLDSNRTLRKLYLHSNRIGNDSMGELCNALKRNHTIKKLTLQNNEIGNDGIKALFPCFYVNTSLNELDLRFNQFDDDCVHAIADSLVHNSTLTLLKLNGNNFGLVAGRLLLNLIKSNPVLSLPKVFPDDAFEDWDDDSDEEISELETISDQLNELSTLHYRSLIDFNRQAKVCFLTSRLVMMLGFSHEVAMMILAWLLPSDYREHKLNLILSANDQKFTSSELLRILTCLKLY